MDIKDHLTDYVESITDHTSKGNKKAYNCPFCNSGHGKNGTGAFNIDPKNPTRWTCFSCGEGGDVLDLIGKVEGIEGYPNQVRRAGELFNIDISPYLTAKTSDEGITVDYSKAIEGAEMEQKNTVNHALSNDYTEFFKKSNDTLQLFLRDIKEYRGISLETFNKFMVGLSDEKLIIPTSKQSYFSRGIKKDFKQKTGNSTPFNSQIINPATEQPIFIVEGELDALSIYEVGGQAVALGSTTNVEKFVKTVASKLNDEKLAKPLILALDNDKAGKDATVKLEKLLQSEKIAYTVANIRNIKDKEGEEVKIKDPNEFLTRNREKFKKWLDDAISKAKFDKEVYLETSTDHFLQGFLNGIANSVNTPCVPTGIKSIDDALDGGLYEGLYIIGAISSLGKTTLTIQIADQIAQSGKDVLIFSLEMARSEIMAKSISRHTILEVLESGGDTKNAKTTRGITNGSRYANYNPTEKSIIQTAITKYGEYANRIYIQEGLGDIGVMQIRETVEKHVRYTGNTPIVIIDYIQILAPYNDRATDKQNTDKAVMELKRISRDFKTSVFGISSFNRDNYNNAVSMQSFKESGAIEYSSDVLLGLQFEGAGTKDFKVDDAKRQNPRAVEMVVLKNRNGKTGTRLKLDFYPMFNYFKE